MGLLSIIRQLFILLLSSTQLSYQGVTQWQIQPYCDHMVQRQSIFYKMIKTITLTNCLNLSEHCQKMPSTWLISIPVLYPGGGAAGGGSVSSQSWQDTGDKQCLQDHSSLTESVRRETKQPSLNCLISFDPFYILIVITDVWNITRNVNTKDKKTRSVANNGSQLIGAGG